MRMLHLLKFLDMSKRVLDSDSQISLKLEDEELPDYLQLHDERRKRMKPESELDQMKYLTTINRSALDFEQTIRCSVTLATSNVYCCLVCGKFLQGIVGATPAFAHATDEDHHVFLHCDTSVVRIVPEGYCLTSKKALAAVFDILEAFSPPLLATLPVPAPCQTLVDRSSYTRGFVGTTNADSALATIVQLLSHLPYVATYLGGHFHDSIYTSQLGLVVRKIWSLRLLHPVLSLQAILDVLEQSFTHPLKVYVWLINKLQKEGRKRTLIYRRALQGKLIDDTQNIRDFWFLLVDVPPSLVFVDSAIREVAFDTLFKQYATQLQVIVLPKYLVVAINHPKSVTNEGQTSSMVVTLPKSILLKVADEEVSYHLFALISADHGQWSISLAQQPGKWVRICRDRVIPADRDFLFLNENHLTVWTIDSSSS